MFFYSAHKRYMQTGVSIVGGLVGGSMLKSTYLNHDIINTGLVLLKFPERVGTNKKIRNEYNFIPDLSVSANLNSVFLAGN